MLDWFVLVTQELEERARVLKQKLSNRPQDGSMPMSDTELSQMSRRQERYPEWDYPDTSSLPPASGSESQSRSRSRDFRPDAEYRHSKMRTVNNREERTLSAAGNHSPSSAGVGPEISKHRSRSYNPDRGKGHSYSSSTGLPASEVETGPPSRSRDRSRSREPAYSSVVGVTAENESAQTSRMHGRNRGDWGDTVYSPSGPSKRPGSYSEPTSPQATSIGSEKLPSAEKQSARKHDSHRGDPDRPSRTRRRGSSQNISVAVAKEFVIFYCCNQLNSPRKSLLSHSVSTYT